ncbi:MAG: hypothetical protein MI673_04790 [Thiotrichales bacterium]|nr:hypothetical protein [Thiotrichales bacterium]
MPRSLLSLNLFILFQLAAGFPAVAGGDESVTSGHAIASERLRNIMQGLNLTVPDTGHPDNQPEEIATQSLEEMLRAAEDLLFHAELISIIRPDHGLDDAELITFRAIAGQLYTETHNIKQISQSYSPNDHELLYTAYRRLYMTCAACHDLFRDH